jgi:hypothetical protein
LLRIEISPAACNQYDGLFLKEIADLTRSFHGVSFLQVVVKILFLIALSAVAVMAQPPEPAEHRVFDEVYLAKDDGSGNPGDAATEFAPADIPIHCVVVLSNSSPVTVRMDLIAANVPGVKAESKIISTSYKTRDLQDRVLFNGKPYKLWVPGAYRADIYIDGNLVGKFPFRIRGATAIPKPAVNYQPKQPVKPRSTTAKRT